MIEDGKLEPLKDSNIKYGQTAEFAFALHTWIQINIDKRTEMTAVIQEEEAK